MPTTSTFHYGFTPDPSLPVTQSRGRQAVHDSADTINGPKGSEAADQRSKDDRRLSYRERRRRGLRLSQSWLTDDRPDEDMNDPGPKYASLEDGAGTIRTYQRSGRITDRKQVQRRTKRGQNPAGLQHKETRTTPGGPACNGSNPMVKRGMSVQDVRDVIEGGSVEGLGAKLAEALDPATRVPGEPTRQRLKRQAVAYAHDGLRARRRLEQAYLTKAVRAS